MDEYGDVLIFPCVEGNSPGDKPNGEEVKGVGAKEENTFILGWLEEVLEYLEDGSERSIRRAAKIVRKAIERLTKKA